MGELLGYQMQPREIAQAWWEQGLQDLDGLVCGTAVTLAESQGYTEAHNANVRLATAEDVRNFGVKLGRPFVFAEDFGANQISMTRSQIDADPGAGKKLYDRDYNFHRAYQLYMARGFQPWAAFNSGVWLHDSYLGRAVLGVANYAGEKFLAYPVPDKPDGEPYKHVFTTPMCDFHFRVQSLTGLATTMRNRLRQTAMNPAQKYDARVLIGAVLTYIKRTRP